MCGHFRVMHPAVLLGISNKGTFTLQTYFDQRRNINVPVPVERRRIQPASKLHLEKNALVIFFLGNERISEAPSNEISYM